MSGAVAEVRHVEVTGNGVATYPAFAEGVERYAITTSEQSDGAVTVAATTSDPGGVVRVDGQRAPGGRRTVTGLAPGDEVSVFVDDADGRHTYSFIYLPVDFPTLERVTDPDVDPTFSHVMITLGLAAPSFETALDANGVPAVVLRTERSIDFKRQPNGHYSVARGTGSSASSFPDVDIVELDEQFREVDRYRTVGLAHTDGHDSILLPDGSRYLMAYETDVEADLVDAVIQHVSASGDVLFSWNSRELLPETVLPSSSDYAHINAFHLMADGDLLVSFRHLSAVLKIARTAHDGFAVGDVVWRLGGRASDFAFETATGSPSDGPCAQHTASELPNGNIMVFDNGSASMFGQLLCVDPADPDGPTVQRVPTRIAEWSLDEENGVATLVRDHQVSNRHSIFAGSAQPLPNGGSMVGWAPNFQAVASEIGIDGAVRWELRDTAATGADRLYTYRAFALDLPDAIAPSVAVGVPPSGATYVEGQRVTPTFSCTDRGGSSLQTCAASAIDTRTPGTRTFTVTATDGDGNVTTVSRRYRVAHRYRPDASIRAAGTDRIAGVERYGASPAQQLVMRSRSDRPFVAFVRVANEGRSADRFRLARSFRSSDYVVQIVGPTTSPRVAPGRSWSVKVRVVPRASAGRGDAVRVRFAARSLRDPRRVDTVWLLARRS